MFASSESIDNANCRHVAFDVEEQKELYEFHTTDSGDDMALNANSEFEFISFNALLKYIFRKSACDCDKW